MYGKECVQERMCTGNNVYEKECVRERMCKGKNVYGKECVRERMCTGKKKHGQNFYPNTFKCRMFHVPRSRRDYDINILRTASFKLFKRPFPGFLTILTL